MIYHILSIVVFFLFVAALIGCVLFACVIIDAIAIWWRDWRNRTTLTCEAIEGEFVFGPQLCMNRAIGIVWCDDDCKDGRHTHRVCAEHVRP